jgi:hypothetical protein
MTRRRKRSDTLLDGSNKTVRKQTFYSRFKMKFISKFVSSSLLNFLDEFRLWNSVEKLIISGAFVRS